MALPKVHGVARKSCGRLNRAEVNAKINRYSRPKLTNSFFPTSRVYFVPMKVALSSKPIPTSGRTCFAPSGFLKSV